jgi:hypothetical protein
MARLKTDRNEQNLISKSAFADWFLSWFALLEAKAL